MQRTYPLELEQWWLDRARAITGVADARRCLEALEPDTARLSNLFTTDRPAHFEDYLSDPRLSAAYGLFFFPQTFVRVGRVLAEWPAADGLARAGGHGPIRVADLGCGTGASTLAVLRRIGEASPGTSVEITAVDRSRAALKLLQELFEAAHSLWPNAVLDAVEADFSRGWAGAESPRDLVLASFALNEAFGPEAEEALRGWIASTMNGLGEAGTLAVVEPAGTEPSTRMERIRDWCAAQGIGRILGPCQHSKPCPMLREGAGWCHDVRRWQVPGTLACLNRRLFRSVHDLKYSFLLLSRSPAFESAAPGGDRVCRLVAPVYRLKGRLRTAGCFGDGALRDIEILTRGHNRASRDRLEALERGDVVTPGNPRMLGDGRTARADDLVSPL